MEPEPETVDLYQQIKSGTLQLDLKRETPHNLPAMRTPFVDRPSDLMKILTLLEQPTCRLLSLVGLGGIGKTRLAIETARSALESFPDGVYFIDCTTIRTPGILPVVMMSVIGGASHRESVNEEAVIAALKNRDILIVLDNFEHLIDGADLLNRILNQTTELKFLITSRERLNIRKEWMIPITPMDVPSNADDLGLLSTYPAVHLFLQTARRVQPGFSLHEHATSVQQICQLVEGMPLALELAASWLRTLSPDAVVEEIRRNLAILTSSARNIEARHRSIQAIFDTSWQMLDEAEQAVLRGLSVFRGSFDRDAAHDVVGASMALIASLIDKSLLQPVADRLRMHKLLWQYASDRLSEHPDEHTQIMARLSMHYRAFARTHQDWHTRPQDHLREMSEEIDNLLNAWAHSIAQADVQAIADFVKPLYLYYMAQGQHSESRELVESALKALAIDPRPHPNPSPAEARLLLLYSISLIQIAHYEQSEAILTSLLPLFEPDPVSWEYGTTVLNIAHSAYFRGRMLEARPYFELAAESFHRSGNRFTEAQTLRWLGTTLAVIGEYEAGIGILNDGLRIAQQLNMEWLRMHLLLALGGSAVNRLGRYEEAYALIEEAMALAYANGERYAVAIAAFNLGRLSGFLGEYGRAEDYCQKSMAIFAAQGNRWGCANVHMHQGAVYALAGDYEKSRVNLRTAYAMGSEIGAILVQMRSSVYLFRTEMALQQPQTALEWLRIAYGHAMDLGIVPLLLDVLAAGSEWLQTISRHDEAAAIAALVYHHPLTESYVREEIPRFLPVVADIPPPDMTVEDGLDIMDRLLF